MPAVNFSRAGKFREIIAGFYVTDLAEEHVYRNIMGNAHGRFDITQLPTLAMELAL